LRSVLKEPVEAAAAGTQSFGELIDLDTGCAFFNEGPPGGVEPDFAPEWRFFGACAGGAGSPAGRSGDS